jgi:hypothetical protein
VLARLDDLTAALADNEAETRRQDILREPGTFADRRAAAGHMFATSDMDEDGYKAAKQELGYKLQN